MRMHTALHLLGAVLPYGVTGGNISSEKSRLDFNMEDTIDKAATQAALDALVAADHAVRCRWISDEELDRQPELVRTMSVKPPRGQGRVRLLEIEGVDLQPCGGTHLASTGEVGQVRIGKVEKKGGKTAASTSISTTDGFFENRRHAVACGNPPFHRILGNGTLRPGESSINLTKSKGYWASESNVPVYAGACRSTSIVLSQCMISTILSCITNIMTEKVEAACRMSYPIST